MKYNALEMLERLCYISGMTKKKQSKIPDINVLAAQIVAKATTEVEEQKKNKPQKNPAAVALGRLGGLKGGKKRAETLSAERRHEIAILAAQARWKSHSKASHE